jgi:hypothetical protein
MLGAKLNEMHDPERRKKANPNRQRRDKDAANKDATNKDAAKPTLEAIPESENLVHA